MTKAEARKKAQEALEGGWHLEYAAARLMSQETRDQLYDVIAALLLEVPKRVIRAIEHEQMFLHSMSDPSPEQKAMQRGASQIARAVRDALAGERPEALAELDQVGAE